MSMSKCVDLSGRYEGRGELIDGDPGAMQRLRSSRLDRAFPFAGQEQATVFSIGATLDYPIEGVVVKESNRVFKVTFLFPNGSKDFRPSFENPERYEFANRAHSCRNGTVL